MSFDFIFRHYSEELPSQSLEAEDQGNFALAERVIMLIEYLSHDTFEQVRATLEDGLGTDYKALMTKGLPGLYSDDEVMKTERTRNPARTLLRDLINRQLTVAKLLGGLKAIGNKKAINLILKDVKERGITLNLPSMFSKDYRSSSYHSTGQPQEHKDAAVFTLVRSTSDSPNPTREQAKTWRAPVQESVFNPLH